MRLILIPLLSFFLLSCKENSSSHGISEQGNDELFDHVEQYVEYLLHPKGGVIAVREIGSGPYIIVLHGGWGMNHEYLVNAFSPFFDRYRFVFYDQRGSLRSRYFEDSLITLNHHVEDLELLRKTLNEDKILIAAHSMGGFLAMNYAKKYPEHIKGIAFIGSTHAINSGQDESREKIMKRLQRQEVLDTLKTYGLTPNPKDCSTPQQYGLWQRIADGATNLHHVRNWNRQWGSFYFSHKAGQLAAESMPKNYNFTGILSELRISLLAIYGDDDFIGDTNQVKEWTSKVDNLQLEIIPNAGHSVWVDRPLLFEQTIQTYFDMVHKDSLNTFP